MTGKHIGISAFGALGQYLCEKIEATASCSDWIRRRARFSAARNPTLRERRSVIDLHEIEEGLTMFNSRNGLLLWLALTLASWAKLANAANDRGACKTNRLRFLSSERDADLVEDRVRRSGPGILSRRRHYLAGRRVHVTAGAVEDVIETFYRGRAAYSYFVGGSAGGRQAMMEAQRFPDDFDGILSARRR